MHENGIVENSAGRPLLLVNYRYLAVH